VPAILGLRYRVITQKKSEHWIFRSGRHRDRPRATKCEGAKLVIRVLLDLRASRAQPSALDMIHADYYSFPKPQHVREFRKRGHRLL
jgi:hypothetical protein